jgi:Iap family predicted aminopeptidase
MLNAHQILKELNFERLTGSAGEKKAIGIIAKYLKQIKLKHRLEPFAVNSFETGTASIKAKGKTFKAHPFGLSHNHSISGEMIFLEDADILLRNKGAYQGKIVLTYTYSRKIAEQFKAAGIKACIAIGSPLHEAPSWSYRQKMYVQGYVPSVTVTYKDGLELSALSGSKIELSIKQSAGKRIGHNIVIDIKGKGYDDNLTLAVGHYDSVARSPGSTDNAGGIVTLLKAAEHFAKNKPQRDLRIVMFSGEELGLRGSFAYAEKHQKEVKERLGLVVNVDVAGDELGKNELIVIGSPQLQGYADGITRETGHYFRASLDIYSSDGMPFAVHEVPAVNICRFGGQASDMIHTPGDDVKHTSQRGLEPTIAAAVNLLDRVLNSKIYPVEKAIDRSLKDKIEKYLWGSLMEAPKLEWTPEYKK